MPDDKSPSKSPFKKKQRPVPSDEVLAALTDEALTPSLLFEVDEVSLSEDVGASTTDAAVGTVTDEVTLSGVSGISTADAAGGATVVAAHSPLFGVYNISLCGLQCRECKALVTLKDQQLIQDHANKHPKLLDGFVHRCCTHQHAGQFQKQARRHLAQQLVSLGYPQCVYSFINPYVPRDKVKLCSCGVDFKIEYNLSRHLANPKNRGHFVRTIAERVTTTCGRKTRIDELLDTARVLIDNFHLASAASSESSLLDQGPVRESAALQVNRGPRVGAASLLPMAAGPVGPYPPNSGLVLQLTTPNSGRSFISGPPGSFYSARTASVGRLVTSGRGAGRMSSRRLPGGATYNAPPAPKTEAQHSVALATDEDLRKLVQLHDAQPLERFVESLIAEDEYAEPYIAMFAGWYQKDPNPDTLQDRLNNLVELVRKPVDKEAEPLLARLIDAIPGWIETVRGTINSIPSNIRTVLNNWTQAAKTGSDSDSNNQPYTCRHYPSTFAQPLELFLTFLCRVPQKPVSVEYTLALAAAARSDHQCFWIYISPILVEAMLEGGTRSVTHEPIILQFLVATSCRIVTESRNPSSEPIQVAKLYSCSRIAKNVATFLSLLKAGSCIYLRNEDCLNPNSVDPIAFADRASRCIGFNKIGPLIRGTRAMSELKITQPYLTTTVSGNIIINDHEYPYAVWTKLIPTTLEILIKLLGEFFSTPDWMRFVDSETAFDVFWVESEFEVVVVGPAGEELRLSAVPITLPPPSRCKALLDQISAYVRIVFDMFGVGAARATEIDRLEMPKLVWRDGTIHYKITIKKSGNYRRCGTSKAVTHILPRTAALIFLVFRYVVREVTGTSSKSCIPVSTPDSSLGRPLKEIFRFVTDVTAREARQFCSGMANYLTGRKGDHLSAEDSLAVAFGHSALTHLAWYASQVVEIEDIQAAFWHASLGYTDNSAEVVLSDFDLVRALVHRFGPGAKFTSKLQDQLVSTSVRKESHVMANLACGEGKSQAWELLLIGHFLTGKQMGTLIVIVPYKFLAETIANAARESLRKARLDRSVDEVVCWLASDDIPEQLFQVGKLPKLIVTTPDWLYKVHQHRTDVLQPHVDHIHRIFIDEAHTMVKEQTFRPCYKSFQLLARYKIPITVLSATLPTSLQMAVCRYIGLCTSSTDFKESVNVIGESKPFTGGYSSGFQFRVERLDDCVQTAKDEAHRQLCKPYLGRRPKVHVICASVEDAKSIYEELSTLYTVGLVTSKVDDDTQKKVAAQWKACELDALVTTSIGLVGNECPDCNTVIICGYVFDLMSAAQAFGRLRKWQRHDGGQILVCLPKHPPHQGRVTEDNHIRDWLITTRFLDEAGLPAFNSVCTFSGLDEWARLSRCRGQSLNESFNESTQQLVGTACRVCDRCRIEPIIAAGLVAQVATSEIRATRVDVQTEIKELLEKCFVCESNTCDGDKCLQGCYLCGSRHHIKKHCTVDYTRYQDFCYNCLDCKSRSGYSINGDHDGKNCPFQRRFRRAIIDRFEEIYKPTVPPRGNRVSVQEYRASQDRLYISSFYDCLDEWLANEDTFNQFLILVYEKHAIKSAKNPILLYDEEFTPESK